MAKEPRDQQLQRMAELLTRGRVGQLQLGRQALMWASGAERIVLATRQAQRAQAYRAEPVRDRLVGEAGETTQGRDPQALQLIGQVLPDVVGAAIARGGRAVPALGRRQAAAQQRDRQGGEEPARLGVRYHEPRPGVREGPGASAL